ncbi:MAG: HAD hydrolase-like protein [Bacteroidales bacterium]
MGNYKEKLGKITTFIFDFDGVMSDGKVWVIDDETQVRNANVKDGYAIHHAVKKGYNVAVISGGKSKSIHYRMDFLGVKDVFSQVPYKKDKFLEYISDNHLEREEVLYMGDDIPDYELMQLAGVSACPADAAVEIQDIADYISHLKGGEGCVRDVIEQVMRLREDWFDESALHW